VDFAAPTVSCIMAAGELCVACINAATAASASSVAPTPQRATDANPPVLGTVSSLRGNWVGRRAWCRQLLIAETRPVFAQILLCLLFGVLSSARPRNSKRLAPFKRSGRQTRSDHYAVNVHKSPLLMCF
tara:strand:- start:99 stop:485 length:387 start_codon:yes stop_codon:yes gene_type:complete